LLREREHEALLVECAELHEGGADPDSRLFLTDERGGEVVLRDQFVLEEQLAQPRTAVGRLNRRLDRRLGLSAPLLPALLRRRVVLGCVGIASTHPERTA